jgi:hypothetical protein
MVIPRKEANHLAAIDAAQICHGKVTHGTPCAQRRKEFLARILHDPTGLWMPSHFVMEAKAEVLLLFPHYEQDDVTYFGYHKLGISPAETDDVK